MLVVRLNDGQSDYKTMGYLFQSTFFVDDSITEGIKESAFVAIKGDGKVAGLYGTEAVATLKYAEAGDRPVGVVYEESRESQYAGQMEMLKNSNNPVKTLLPYGNIEDRAIGLLRHGVMIISKVGETKYRHFNTVGISGTLTSFDSSLDDGAESTTEIEATKLKGLKVGDIIYLGSDKKKAILSSLTGGKFKVKNISGGAITSSDTAFEAKSAIGEPVYLNTNQKEAGELPFTLDPSSGVKVGWIESPISVRFNLDLAL